MDLLEEYSISSEEEGDEAATTMRDTSGGDAAVSKQKATKRGRVQLVSSNDNAANLFVRRVPHVRGHWAGHVFCELPPSQQHCRRARSSVTRFCNRLETTGWSGTVVSHSHLHVSLSRPFFVQECNIESLVNALKQRLSLEQAGTRLLVTGERLLVNDDQTRSFWCWTLSSNPFLKRIVAHVNAVLQHYQQEPYYTSPEFHVSLASLAGDVSELLLDGQQDGHDTESNDEDGDDDDDDEDPIVISIDYVCVTFGATRSFRIDLKQSP